MDGGCGRSNENERLREEDETALWLCCRRGSRRETGPRRDTGLCM